jgi:hypothetical protein
MVEKAKEKYIGYNKTQWNFYRKKSVLPNPVWNDRATRIIQVVHVKIRAK